jgi:hypothetical protein
MATDPASFIPQTESSFLTDTLGGGDSSSSLTALALGGLGGFGLQQLGVFDEGGLLGAPSRAGSLAAQAQAAGKQQGIETLTRELTPFREAGLQGLEGLLQGSTAQGFGANLGELLGGGALQPLIAERGRAVQGQLAAGGLTRSGAGLQAAAAVPTDLALQIEQMLSGRQAGLAQTGFEAASGIGGGVAGLQAGIGRDIGAGIVTDAQAKAGQQQGLLSLASTAASFFSDPRLKENTKVIGEIGDLKVYSWDWIKETAGTIIEKFPKVGFMADQVKDKYPQFIQEVAGFMTVDIGGLLNKLEAANGNA